MAHVKNIIGNVYGKLTVIDLSPERDKLGHTRWICRCSCPNQTIITVAKANLHLNYGGTKSCGCVSLINDLTGQVFGRLTVTSLSEERTSTGSTKWNCLCDCGNTTIVSNSNLNSGATQSCGCIRFQDIAGQTFGRLFAVRKLEEKNKAGATQYVCRCSCDNKETIVSYSDLINNNTKSCGCYHKDTITKHGMTNDPIYAVWASMLDRCLNPNNQGYHNYGGRGINVAENWKTFENFYADMGPRPGPEYSIDRKNNDGNYEPGNCQWTTVDVQANNRRDNVFHDYKGEILTSSQIARKYNINLSTFYNRLYSGWSVEKAIETPVK